MPTPPPDELPREVRAGDTLRWSRSPAAFPASAGWVLAYTLIAATAVSTVTATADGDGFQVEVSAAATAAWPAGMATLIEYATLAGERHTLGEYRLRVLPNLAAATVGVDTRSHAQKVLDNINAWLESKSDFAGELQLDGRRIRTYTLEELLALRSRYAAIVAGEVSGHGLVRRMVVQL